MTLSFITSSLAGGMLLLGLLMVSRMRLRSLVGLFQIQSLLLASIAAALAYTLVEAHFAVLAILILGVKAIFIPHLLLRVASREVVAERLAAYARPTLLTFLAVGVTLFAFTAVRSIPIPAGAYFATAVSFALVLLGLLLLVSRKDMWGQGIGFLVMENGIFTFGLSLTHGMPLLIELGVLFDLLTLFILMVALVRRAQAEHASVETDYLRELTD